MDKYGLIGYPLGHSFSISYHNQRFADEGINAKYLNFEIPSIEDLPAVLGSNPELKGLNVTIPYARHSHMVPSPEGWLVAQAVLELPFVAVFPVASMV